MQGIATGLVSFAAAQLGLNKVKGELRKALSAVSNTVRNVLRTSVHKFASVIDGLSAKGMFSGILGKKTEFTYNGKTYVLWVAEASRSVQVKIAEKTGATTYNLIGALTAKSFTNGTITNEADKPTTHMANLIAAAKAYEKAITDARATRPPNLMATLRNLRTALKNAETVVKNDILANACTALNQGCFAAGTKYWTPEGYRNVEDLQPGEFVYSRTQYDPDGIIEAKVIEEKFERTGRILHLHLKDGALIRTTPEHPFYVKANGWTEAGALQAGDLIRTDTAWVEVVELLDTEEYETVYNVRVADHHTYFVGDVEWGFVVWAHNAGFTYCGLDGDNLEGVLSKHFTEGVTQERANLDPAHAGETVSVKASGSEIDVSTTSSPTDQKSYVIYAFVNKATGNIDYVGRAKTNTSMSNTSIEAAVKDRLRVHKRLGTFNSNTQAVIVLAVQKTQDAYRGAEQYFYEIYKTRGTLVGNTYAPLDSTDARSRQKNVGYLNSFFKEVGYSNPRVNTTIDSRRNQ